MNLSSGRTLWFTGLSGAGKSAIARALLARLRRENARAIVLDGDELRDGLNSDLGYSARDRTENLRRIAHVAKLFQREGFVIIVATISPAQSHRDRAREILGPGFIEVFIDASLKACEMRDPKGLYKRARVGEITDFTGVAAPYDRPQKPDLTLETEVMSVEDCVGLIVAFLSENI